MEPISTTIITKSRSSNVYKVEYVKIKFREKAKVLIVLGMQIGYDEVNFREEN